MNLIFVDLAKEKYVNLEKCVICLSQSDEKEQLETPWKLWSQHLRRAGRSRRPHVPGTQMPWPCVSRPDPDSPPKGPVRGWRRVSVPRAVYRTRRGVPAPLCWPAEARVPFAFADLKGAWRRPSGRCVSPWKRRRGWKRASETSCGRALMAAGGDGRIAAVGVSGSDCVTVLQQEWHCAWWQPLLRLNPFSVRFETAKARVLRCGPCTDLWNRPCGA